VYVLLAPHLEVGGWGNSGRKLRGSGQNVLLAWKNRTYLALGANVGFTRGSCGYVGTSDGWQDLSHNFQLDWEFDRAQDGNVALIGEIDVHRCQEFTLGLAFGNAQHAAVTTLMQSLGEPFGQHRKRFVEQWHRVANIEKLPRTAAITGACIESVTTSCWPMKTRHSQAL
jgi:glucoamylase